MDNAFIKISNRILEKGKADLNFTGSPIPWDSMLIWQWGQGVGLYGVAKAYERTKDIKYYDFIKSFADKHINAGIKMSINTAAPLLAVMILITEKNDKYYKLCQEFADWFLAEAPRAERGAFEHSCTETVYDNEIWLDTLFMGCIFLAKWGVYTSNRMYINEAVRQYNLHYKFTLDAETGLLHHGYYCNSREKVGALWGRGNGWFAAGSAEMLKIIPEDVKGSAELKKNFKNHIENVYKYQDISGGWHTVINSDKTYIESSGTAAFAYAGLYAVKKGFIPGAYMSKIDNAYKFIEENVSSDGIVLLGSGGTCIMRSEDEYNNVKCRETYYTQGLASLALSEKIIDINWEISYE